MKSKIKEWLKRYIPAEIVSLITTVLSAWLAHIYGGGALTVALAGTWGGNAGYYGYILVADISTTVRHRRQQAASYRLSDFLRNIRALIVEFGFAELIDSLFIRPALMYYLPQIIGDLYLGILAGKLAADILFYLPAIAGYEAAKKYLRQ